MLDRLFLGLILLMLFLESGLIIANKVEIQELKNMQQITYSDIKEVQKKQRINAQDIGFLQRLILEGSATE